MPDDTESNTSFTEREALVELLDIAYNTEHSEDDHDVFVADLAEVEEIGPDGPELLRCSALSFGPRVPEAKRAQYLTFTATDMQSNDGQQICGNCAWPLSTHRREQFTRVRLTCGHECRRRTDVKPFLHVCLACVENAQRKAKAKCLSCRAIEWARARLREIS